MGSQIIALSDGTYVARIFDRTKGYGYIRNDPWWESIIIFSEAIPENCIFETIEECNEKINITPKIYKKEYRQTEYIDVTFTITPTGTIFNDE